MLRNSTIIDKAHFFRFVGRLIGGWVRRSEVFFGRPSFLRGVGLLTNTDLEIPSAYLGGYFVAPVLGYPPQPPAVGPFGGKTRLKMVKYGRRGAM